MKAYLLVLFLIFTNLCFSQPCSTHSDFSIQQNICNPLSVQFSDAGSNATNTYWSFGDGSTVTGNLTPAHIYSAAGNYIIKYYSVNAGCGDTVTKSISVSVINEDIILSRDTIMCFGTSKQLQSSPALSFCWSPTTYLDNPNSQNPITSSPQNITYYLNERITGTNLVVNGDFSSGNTGFTSQYNYANPNFTEGEYFVGTNPQAWNRSLSSCGDHTSGSGNMMLVNGSPAPDVNVWKETIAVTPNTNYEFSTWLQALWPPNPAQLRFSINGKDIGNLITASLPTCRLTQFFTTWNSGNNTTAIISIVNKNTAIQGNDFALDDISFAPVFFKRDSVIITVDKPIVTTSSDKTVCSGTTFQINTSGAANYTWAPITGLSNPNIPNPVAIVINPITYIVTGTNTNGCIAKDTLSFTTFLKPVIKKTSDTTICHNTSMQIFASGGSTYLWSPSSTLSNPNVSNPVASPASTITYFVTITDINSCIYSDSVKLTVTKLPVFSISRNQSVCVNNSKQLSASGGNFYLWQPSNFLSNPNISNPVATPKPGDTTTTYSIKIKDSTCNDSTLLTTTVAVLQLPIIKANKTNDVDCSNGFSKLSASGGRYYIWSPARDLSDSTIANPIARPVITTQYLVKGSDINGCINSDTITINANFNNAANYLMPNSFTPNGDGLNDCYGLKYWGNVTELEFSIYNRFGERVFYTTDPINCWDGKYKGQSLDGDTFVYVIKAKTICATVNKKGYFLLIK